MCPGAPFLIEGTATATARTVPDLLAACGDALDRLPPADRTVLIGSGTSGRKDGPGADPHPAWRCFPPGVAVRTSVTRSDIPATVALWLPAGECSDVDEFGDVGEGDGTEDRGGPAGMAAPAPSVATLVGAHLLCAARHLTPTSAVEVMVGGPAGVTVALPPELSPAGRADRVTLLVIADGAACHGDNAPGRRDDRSGAFDAAVARALAAGDPAALREACRDPELPAEGVMASVRPLALLADLTGAVPPDTAELLYSGAPFGVGYFVASWRWTRA